MDANEVAYAEGHQAYHDGHRLKDNPYKRHSEQWEEWRTGWSDEKADDPYWERVRRIQAKALKNIKNDLQ
jgi:ribosome modulation factor